MPFCLWQAEGNIRGITPCVCVFANLLQLHSRARLSSAVFTLKTRSKETTSMISYINLRSAAAGCLCSLWSEHAIDASLMAPPPKPLLDLCHDRRPVPRPRVSIILFPCCSAAFVKKRSDCSIVAARTRSRPPTHYLLLTISLIERRVRGAWRSKHAPGVGRAHGRDARRVRGSSCVKKKRCKRSRPGAEGEGSDAPDQIKVEATASARGAAGHELGSGAEPRACAIADGLGLGKGLVACARPGARN